jgi:hypothetical protein
MPKNTKQAANKSSSKIVPKSAKIEKAADKKIVVTGKEAVAILRAVVEGKYASCWVRYYAVRDCKERKYNAQFNGPQRDTKTLTGLSFQVNQKRGQQWVMEWRGCRLDCIAQIAVANKAGGWIVARLTTDKDAQHCAERANRIKAARKAAKLSGSPV